MDNSMDPYSAHHGFVSQERFHQQNIRRGSPLAQVRHPTNQEHEEMPYPGPTIDAPVPKHRHQISVTLQQEFENSEAYQQGEAREPGDTVKDADGEGFTTNPVSPAPVLFPQQPDMPSVETDVHIGPELASNPDDDVSDIEAEKQQNKQEARKREDSIEQNVYEVDQSQPLPQQFMPQSHYAVHAHSRDQSLSQMQHDYDTADPIQNSAMSMLMAGEGLGRGDHHLDELLSEDGRTNISDIVTNPSESPSPRRTFSTTTSHGHHMSNNSNIWASEHSKNAPSTTSSASKAKLNAKAAEFKFDPATSFTFVPKSNSFSPTSQMASTISPETHSRDHSSSSAVGFGGFGAGFNTGSFRPSLVSGGAYTPLFEKGAAAFSPNAPAFTPSFAKPTPAPVVNSIFGDIVKPPPVKKVIPIIRPPSRLQLHDKGVSVDASSDRRESTPEGGRKRVKHGPTLGDAHDTEVPALSTIAPPSVQQNIQEPKETEDKVSESSDEGEQLMQAPLEGLLGTSYPPFEFRDKLEAEGFANASPMNGGPGRYESKVNIIRHDDILSPDEAFLAAASQTPPPPATSQVEEEKFNIKPDVSEFSIKPTTRGFDFEFLKLTTPPKKVFGGMSESRYAHTPSPPPSQPAPPPPILPDGSTFLPPRAPTPYNEDIEPEKEAVPMPTPTDAELDEVIKYMDYTSTIYVHPSEETEYDEDVEGEDMSEEGEPIDLQGTLEEQSPWKLDSPVRMPISMYEDPISHKQIQNLRSAGPSPSPRRGGLTFIHHRASSFSPDEPDLPIHEIDDNRQEEIGIAKDADSDWDDMISDEGGKLRPQSRLFFDAHVEELVGGLFQRRLEPVLNALATINDTLHTVTELGSIKSPGDPVQSDADDEEDSSEMIPPKSPKDRKLEKIKAALSEVLVMQQSGTAISEPSLRAIKDAVASSHGREFAEVKATIAQVLANAARNEDIVMVASNVSAIKDAVREDVSIMRDAVRDAVDEIITNVGDRVDDTKFVLKDVSALQRSDIAEVKAAITSSLTSGVHKDLLAIHNVLADANEKSAKTDELTELKAEIMNSLTSIDTKSTYQEVLKLKQENNQFGDMLQEVLRLTQDNAANMEFHQDAQQEAVKEGHVALTSRVGDVYSAVREVTGFIQSRASKTDMRRNLAEKEQKQDAVAIRNAIADTNLHIQEGLKELERKQPNLDDFRSVVETSLQPKIDDFKSVFDGLAATVPGLDDIKRAVEEILKADSGIAEFKKVVEEDRERKVEESRTVINQVSDAQPTLQDFRTLMEDVISKQQLFVPLNFDSQDDSKEKLQRKVESIERDAAHFQKRWDEEAQSKREWQEKTIELEAKLKIAEEETVKQREIAEEKDRRLKTVDEKRHQTLTSAQMRSALLEGAHSSLQKSNGELSAKNAELEGSIRQAQASEEKHRAWNLQLEGENKELRKAMEMLKSEMEESIKVRESFRTKFDRIQEDMRRVSLEIGQEQGKWRKTQDEQNARIEVLEAKLAAEVTKNQSLEGEVKRLEMEEKEAIRLRIETDQLNRAGGKAEELIAQLRQESMENQSRIAQLVHEVDQARESAREEVHRVRSSLQVDIDASNAEVISVKDRLGKEVEEARNEVNRVTQQAALEKENMDQLLKEAQDSKTNALRGAEDEQSRVLKEVAQSKSAALQDQQRKYERQLEEVRVRNERAYRIATEDAEREQYFLQERLNIAQAESKNLRDHIESLQTQVKTLNENFKVANQAAQAAAQAATTVREMTASHVSDEHALRESIETLQIQLQEREADNDQLKSELTSLKVDKTKFKEAEGQLNMYRELLDLRVDDLEEIIHTCTLPHLDRGTLQDAATRLKASLKMQLQEKERAMDITKPDDKLAAVQLAAAKLPGAASAAWQTFKNRGKASSESPSKTTPTPSRPSSAASGFLNGILTPPSTTLAGAPRRFGVGFGRSGLVMDAPESVTKGPISTRQQEKRPTPAARRPLAPPAGPTAHALLFRRDNYDADADSSVLSSEFYDDESDATEVGGDHGEMEPFGVSPYSRR